MLRDVAVMNLGKVVGMSGVKLEMDILLKDVRLLRNMLHSILPCCVFSLANEK